MSVITRSIQHLPAFDRWEYEERLDRQLKIITGDPRARDLEFRSCEADDIYFFTRHFRHEDIHDPGSFVRLLPNEIQLSLNRDVATEVILKARKAGVSTFIDAKILHGCLFRPRTRAMIISHDRDHTSQFIARIRAAWEALPEFLRFRLKTDARNELEFENGSVIRAATAGNVKIGRGSDIDLLHLSEAAFYPDLQAILSVAVQAMRWAGGARIWWESTPNGFNEFRELYTDARDGTIDDAAAFFFPWWLDHKNVVALEGRESIAFDSSMTPEERSFKKAHSLTLEQMAFRRKKQRELKESFLQEYPEDDETCFLTSGTPKFDVPYWRQLLTVVEKRVRPLSLSILIKKYGALDGLDDGSFTVWDPPREGHLYVLGSDVAEGLPSGCFSHGGILDVTNMARRIQVAEWHGKIPPGDWGIKAARIARAYNQALLGFERNNHGHASLFAASRVEGYFPIYRHREMDQTGRVRGRMGFPTTPGTRQTLLDSFQRNVKANEHIVRSKLLCREALTFQSGDEDRADEDARFRVVHNDSVFGWAIADWIALKGSSIPVA